MKTTKTIGLCRTKRAYTSGVTCMATPQETELGLALKLHEEVGEVCRAPRDVEEYADVLQALRDYARLNGVAWEDVEAALSRKEQECGPFLPGLLWRIK